MQDGPPERILAIVETAVGDVHGGTYKRELIRRLKWSLLERYKRDGV